MKKSTVSLTLLALLITTQSASAYTNADLNCIAKAVYYEANVEPYEGKVAVAQVIINRTKNANRPKSICAVVKQPGQFSWYYPGVLDDKIGYQYKILAQEVLDERHEALLPGAEYFHRDIGHRPKWTKNLQPLGKIGHHIFYAET